MEFIGTYIINPLNTVLWSYLLIFTLIPLAIYFTFRTRFVQFRYFFHMFKVITEGTKKKSKNGQKCISPFQAFCIGCASRVGTGNIAGIAIALTIGGPGAIFWMWLLAIFGSASAFVESTLAQIYKVKDGNGYRGGPAYYMKQALKKRWMGVLFSILLIICFGFVFNSVQANTIANSFDKAFGIETWMTGAVITAITAIVIFGGIRRIAHVTEFLVPIMAVVYLCVVAYVFITNINMVPYVFSLIFKGAFGLTQFTGGLAGVTVQVILQTGIARGLFSNEAGMGSAPNAAATAETSHPVKQGLIQAMGVFFDTLVICSATAFIVILAGKYSSGGYEGVQLTQESLSYFVGSWGNPFIAISILMFAYSSILGNYYYGETNIEFMSEKKRWLLLYRLAVIVMVFFGCIQKVSVVWNMADVTMGLMATVNLIAIFLLGKFAFRALNNYTKQLKEGKNPIFHRNSIEGVSEIECWEKE
jgi:alanine or glycine:cation symporter, AGCS family